MQENTEQNISKYGQFLRSCSYEDYVLILSLLF